VFSSFLPQIKTRNTKKKVYEVRENNYSTGHPSAFGVFKLLYNCVSCETQTVMQIIFVYRKANCALWRYTCLVDIGQL
jgi:hypothetical protein